MSDFIHIIRSPNDPNVIPQEVGQHWINTTTKTEFFSVGTSAISDWRISSVTVLKNEQTDVDLVIPNDVKFIRVFGTGLVTLTIPDNRPEIDLVVKSINSQIVTVVKETGQINNKASIEIAPDPVNGIGDSYTFIKQGGQWWLN